jgi:hypothetical protein
MKVITGLWCKIFVFVTPLDGTSIFQAAAAFGYRSTSAQVKYCMLDLVAETEPSKG